MASNILEEVQEFVARKLNADSELSACVTFLAENKKDIDFEIKNALGKQGIVGCVLTPKATYQGKYEDLFLAWQLDELEIDVVENPIVNRGRKNGYMTGQDAAMKVFQVLCPLAGEDEGQFNPVSYEEGEDNGLLVNKCVLKTLVYGEHQDEPGPEPELRMKFVKLLDEPPPEGVQPRDGWMWREGTGFKICQGEAVYDLGVAYDVMSAYVESAVSAKADLSAIPTKTSQLSNDSGYVTSAQVVPSQVNAGNASASDKSLVSQALAEDAADEHSTRVVVDEYGNAILQKYTTGWYVSKIEEGTGSPVVYTETDAYYAFVSDIRIEQSEGRLYYTVGCQDKQRNLVPKYRQSHTTSYSADEFIADVIYWTVNEAGHYIGIHLTITNAETPVWVDVARLVPDSSKYSGLLDTQITPNGQFLTPAQVKPYTVIQGYARRAQGSLFLFGRSLAQVPDENHFVTIDYGVRKLCYAGLSYYPWHLSMYDGTTFDPPLEMVYGYRTTVGYKVNGRVRNIAVNSNCWLAMQTVDARNTRPLYIKAFEDDSGQMIPDNNLYIAAVAHPITFDEFKRSIETIDGVAGDISCTRESAGTYTTELKYFPFEDDLSSKADLSSLGQYFPLSGGYLTGPVFADGAVETPQLNVRNDALDESIIIRHDQPSSLQVFDGLDTNLQHPATLPVRRDGTVAYVSDVEQAVSSKADISAIPTKTSQLSNDSGFVEQNGTAVINSLTCDQLVANQAHIVGYATSSDLSAKRGLSDMTVRGVPQNDNSESWFTIKYGTTTENAWYYGEGRWETGQTLRVLAAPATIFSLQKQIEGQWTNLGEFQLDSDAEAAVTYGGVTYSITGYVGELVASNQLPEVPRYVPLTIKQDRTLYPSSQTITVKTSPAKTLTVATNPNGNGGTFVANFMTSGWSDNAALSDVVTAPDTAGCLVFKTSGQSSDTWGNLKSTPVSDVESFDIAFPL